jgi:hypothetical protein
MTATHEHHSTVPTVPVLYFSLELLQFRRKGGYRRGPGAR